MPSDALLVLQAQATKTSTFTSAALNLPAGTPRRGLKARIIYSAADNVSGTNTVTFSLNVAHDGGTNYYAEFQADPITLSTTAQQGELFIPFEVSPTSVANQINLELVCTIAGSGTSPTITYYSDIQLARP